MIPLTARKVKMHFDQDGTGRLGLYGSKSDEAFINDRTSELIQTFLLREAEGKGQSTAMICYAASSMLSYWISNHSVTTDTELNTTTDQILRMLSETTKHMVDDIENLGGIDRMQKAYKTMKGI